MSHTALPEAIRDESQLEGLLSTPTEAAVSALGRLEGDVLVLGVGGKMGPSLARMVVRASEEAGVRRRVYGVSRFSTPRGMGFQPVKADAQPASDLEKSLRNDGIETIRGDLLDEAFVRNLPDAPNVIFMTGQKFGTAADASATWAMNAYVPTLVCRRFPASRILAFSTGNVYPFVPIASGGSVETDRLEPVGEYGMSALGRERMFEYFSRRQGTPVTIVRLNYAVEMRYGILVDLAQQVLAGESIDVAMGYANVIWQGDANALALASLADAASPPLVMNVAGPDLLDVRETCQHFARLFGNAASFNREPAATALLSNATKAYARYGRPRVELQQLIEWTADWLRRGGKTSNKPTHFQARDGKF
jgi:nucleoside-diphosphate-sugar epimerase